MEVIPIQDHPKILWCIEPLHKVMCLFTLTRTCLCIIYSDVVLSILKITAFGFVVLFNILAELDLKYWLFLIGVMLSTFY